MQRNYRILEIDDDGTLPYVYRGRLMFDRIFSTLEDAEKALERHLYDRSLDSWCVNELVIIPIYTAT